MISKSRIFIGPPGAGKSTLKQKYPDRVIDLDGSINWDRMSRIYGRYAGDDEKPGEQKIFEHELNWPLAWVDEVLPRLWTALLLEKDIVMGLITPSNAELVSRFLAGLNQETVLILPDIKTHYHFNRQDKDKRPQTWGAELRGWQNAYWTRLLLQGLARESGIKIVEKIRIPGKARTRRQGLAVREAVDDKGNFYVETFFGRWAQLNPDKEFKAMYLAKEPGDNRIELHCDRTAKICAKGKHDCNSAVILKNDINGYPLKNYIARDKLKAPRRRGKNAIIFFAGTLAPFHHGHLDALDSAKSYLESQGWKVIGGYVSAFAEIREGRAGALDPILGPVDGRNIMLQLGLARSDWIMADFPVRHVLSESLLADQEHPVQKIVKRLRENGALDAEIPVTTFWLNGKDAIFEPEFFKALVRHMDRDESNPLRMLIIDNRKSHDAWSRKELVSAPGLMPHISRFRSRQKDQTSATKAREALQTANRTALAKAVGLPMVEAYLMGKMSYPDI